ncbi:MAG: Crp/Fnr family transcriptional regulator [Acidimicrobiales bacterium]
MSPELWSAVVAVGQRRVYPAGSLIFAEGDPFGPVLAILGGSVALTAGDGGRLDELGPGELLGELSAVDGFPRSASALAITDTEVLAIDPERFAHLLADDPKLALYLLRSVGRRLRRATTRSIRSSSAPSRVRVPDLSRDLGRAQHASEAIGR